MFGPHCHQHKPSRASAVTVKAARVGGPERIQLCSTFRIPDTSVRSRANMEAKGARSTVEDRTDGPTDGRQDGAVPPLLSHRFIKQKRASPPLDAPSVRWKAFLFADEEPASPG